MEVLSFYDEYEGELMTQFEQQGYVILDVENSSYLQKIQNHLVQEVRKWLKLPDEEMNIEKNLAFLNQVHHLLSIEEENDFRLAMIHSLNSQSWMRHHYFHLAKSAIQVLVGNELAMQKRVNLSIQLPNDDSSLLYVHADSWNGDSPYEMVVWLPLVDCYQTKSMFILPQEKDSLHRDALGKSEGIEAFYQRIEPDLTFLKVKYGQILLFNQNMMHGNRINTSLETRWSMNVRFKSALTPYADKKNGEFFEPITLRSMTKLGAAYQFPEVKRS